MNERGFGTELGKNLQQILLRLGWGRGFKNCIIWDETVDKICGYRRCWRKPSKNCRVMGKIHRCLWDWGKFV